jgi:DNA-binding NarL/FixJ family response regulator
MQTAGPGRVSTLVVDDSQAARAAMCSLLATYDQLELVGTASDGLEAVELARIRHPRLIVMDVQMPRMNGVTASAMLTQESPNTQIILVSLHDSPELRLLCHRSGARAFIGKSRISQELAPIVAAIYADIAAEKNPVQATGGDDASERGCSDSVFKDAQ